MDSPLEPASGDARAPRGWDALGGAFRSVRLSPRRGWRRFLGFAGPGALVAVGYMDPGNWATDLVGGSRFGYALLSVVLLSNLMAMLLQTLCVRLGVGSGLDLAQGCREAYPRAAVPLWLLAELAIAATDLAEVLGSAIALKLLFGLPLPWGVALTSLDVLLLLALQGRGIRALEVCIIVLVSVVAGCLGFELLLSRPDLGGVLRGYVPGVHVLQEPGMLYVAIGILGATVMPHNLYLHSSLVHTRAYEPTEPGRREAVRHATLDSVLSLSLAMLVNSALLILAASTFHVAGLTQVAELEDAHRLLAPLLGSAGAATLFAVALLAAGQSATLTGTLSGQIVMTGFLRIRLRPWVRRLATRAVALVPALLVTIAMGERGAGQLLVASQVVLSLQLPFAVFPLLRLTSDAKRMGPLVSPRWMRVAGYGCAVLITALNAYLLATLMLPHK
ncbi:divalent metal cation transporter [Aggregicoccus sp. 17bor-14]|uniref:Nramp family divalent metal transporter n=1 Tax=Myxococcaceae TaxID=31 RepID=UPI00129C252D|nr:MULTISPECIES: Nramp family divalent metal transporter [Myxococcaceae]MBF5042052.1 Nramp family divalent metal transporter [Simulacricoccus sp. 17bor-14]MRI87830.1 divalent metal cation transporter [Aggregicoccus sp. 17bor-14]